MNSSDLELLISWTFSYFPKPKWRSVEAEKELGAHHKIRGIPNIINR